MIKGLFKTLYKGITNGRNGIDDIVKFQFYFLVLLVILDLFVDSYTVGFLQLITMIIMIYRFMSKDVFKRLRENEKFCNFRYDLFCKFFTTQNHTATWTTKGFVCGGGYNISIGNRGWMKSCCYKSCNMCHIHH